MVLKKLKPNLKFSNIQTEGVYDDYDLFSLFDDEKQKYNLKISLDDSEGILKKNQQHLKIQNVLIYHFFLITVK